ncbi:MAG: ABC transporter permease [Muribaculaceae bacterium]|nr:ABC transporter permease [Muribaculaceae bacterium]
MLDIVREILQTLAHNKLRTALTGLAVAWGIFMLIVLLGMSRGLYNSMQRNNSMERSSYINVWGGWTGKAHKGYKEGRRIELEAADIEPLRVRGGSHVESAIASVSIDSAKVSTMRDYVTDGVMGVYPQAAAIERAEMRHGRFINARDIEERRKVMVINESNARLLFGSADSAVGRRVDCMGLSWTVAGVYDNDWQRTSYVPFSTAMMLRGNNGVVGDINVRLKDMHDMADADDAERGVRAELARRHDFAADDMGAVHIWNRFEGYLQQQTGGAILEAVVWIIGLLTMLSGIVGVSNIMFVSVRERTHEIGIRRAIGAKPRDVLGQVLAESVAITALFGYIGVFLGIVVTEIIDKLFGSSDFLYNPRVDISIAMEVTVVLVVVGALAGLFPAIKATKVKPVEALRDE